MKIIFLTGFALMGMLLWGSMVYQQSNHQTVADTLTEQDTLLAMIEEKVALKVEQQKIADEFRKRKLPRNYTEKIQKYLPIIKKYSDRYELDWRLIVAQILKESYFRENARSHVGAMGLMQIMPRTAREITRELDIAYISKDPQENIAAGIYYMYKQLKYFSDSTPEHQLKLALAAYNCGTARIFDAQDIARFKGLDPNAWNNGVRECLPLLTRESGKLHLEVWEQGEPNYGYFNGSDETVDYVDDIYHKYLILNTSYPQHVTSLGSLEQQAGEDLIAAR